MACEFDAMGALSTKYNDTRKKRPVLMMRTVTASLSPAAAVWSWWKNWNTPGAWRAHLCRNRRLRRNLRWRGHGCPSGEGAVRCMQMAMHGVDTPIDYLNSHGTSTPVGDVKELGAIREVFGDNSPAISATKAMTGHSLGAAGVQEAIYSLLMLEHGFIAPSINVEELDEQAAGLNIVTKPTDAKLTTVMSNSFGFGGTNATLVMRKYNA
jgi:3-oxoacyl-[acyl-carrier-protein] synthase-1